MVVVEELEEWPRGLPYPVLAIGIFDGLHLGHQSIIRGLIERARARQGTSLLLTFHPHPQKIIRPAEAPQLLQTTGQKEEMLREMGVDVLIRLPFTRRLSLYTPREFAEKILVSHGIREIRVGSNFRFGHRRSGDFSTLESLGTDYGFEVQEVQPVCLGEERISSTKVRKALREGKVSPARRMLGRHYQIGGTVVRGSGKGAELGFPTANLLPENELIPAVGVYVTCAAVNGEVLDSVTNIGYRPTVHEEVEPGSPVVETHLIGWSGNMYGKHLTLEFCMRLRDEKRFEGLSQLVDQIGRDVERGRRYFRRVARGKRQRVIGERNR